MHAANREFEPAIERFRAPWVSWFDPAKLIAERRDEPSGIRVKGWHFIVTRAKQIALLEKDFAVPADWCPKSNREFALLA